MNETSCYKINGRIFFKHKDVPCKRRVMKTLGVKKNTFAGNMISRVYDYYFQGAINFKKECNYSAPRLGHINFGQNGENKISVLPWLYCEKWITFQCNCQVLFACG